MKMQRTLAKLGLTCCLILLFLVKVSAQKTTANPQLVEMNTTAGTIKILLYDATPKHRDNFVSLVEKGFYDSLLFHRVIPQFMIQGGDPGSKNAPAGTMLGNGDTGVRVPAEFSDSLIHKKGVLAAARDNNPEKASSGCQFYLVVGKVYTEAELQSMEQQTGKTYTAEQRKQYTTVGGTPFLDMNYTVYGEVLEGQDVVDKIALVARNQYDRPNEDVRILKATLIKDKKERKRLLETVWKK